MQGTANGLILSQSILTSHRRAMSLTQTDGLTHDATRPVTKGSMAMSDDMTHLYPVAIGSQMRPGAKDMKKLSKVEIRKQRRLARQAEWDVLLKRKPDAKYEDPADVCAIDEATRMMGDFKLKTSSDYVVPEDQRVNADKKRIQIVLLREQMFERRKAFNVKLLALRDKKEMLVEEIQSDLRHLVELQRELSADKRVDLPPEPFMHPEEVPERQLETNPEKLRKFKRQYDAKMAAGQKQRGWYTYGRERTGVLLVC